LSQYRATRERKPNGTNITEGPKRYARKENDSNAKRQLAHRDGERRRLRQKDEPVPPQEIGKPKTRRRQATQSDLGSLMSQLSWR
jgi:hypothetical protein